MPRFFFPVRDGQDFDDLNGETFHDAAAARDAARVIFGELIPNAADLWSQGELTVEVRDEGRRLVGRIGACLPDKEA